MQGEERIWSLRGVVKHLGRPTAAPGPDIAGHAHASLYPTAGPFRQSRTARAAQSEVSCSSCQSMYRRPQRWLAKSIKGKSRHCRAAFFPHALQKSSFVCRVVKLCLRVSFFFVFFISCRGCTASGLLSTCRPLFQGAFWTSRASSPARQPHLYLVVRCRHP